MDRSSYLSFNENREELKFSGPDLEAATELLKGDLPLKEEWVVWEQIANDGRAPAAAASGAVGTDAYGDSTKEVASVRTVQEFWALWNHLPQPSLLLESQKIVRSTENGTTHSVDALMVFTRGVKPHWEDARNAEGAHFQFQLRPVIGGPQIDEFWNNIILGMVGATIEPAGMITGARLVDKLGGPKNASGLRIEVWFDKVADQERVVQLQNSVLRTMATRLDGSVNPSLPKFEVKLHGK